MKIYTWGRRLAITGGRLKLYSSGGRLSIGGGRDESAPAGLSGSDGHLDCSPLARKVLLKTGEDLSRETIQPKPFHASLVWFLLI